MKQDLVLIKWKDITSSHVGWMEEGDLEDLKTATCYTPGWIVKEDKNNYYVVSTVMEHNKEWTLSFDTVIPKGVVEKITVLRKRWKS